MPVQQKPLTPEEARMSASGFPRNAGPSRGTLQRMKGVRARSIQGLGKQGAIAEGSKKSIQQTVEARGGVSDEEKKQAILREIASAERAISGERNAPDAVHMKYRATTKYALDFIDPKRELGASRKRVFAIIGRVEEEHPDFLNFVASGPSRKAIEAWRKGAGYDAYNALVGLLGDRRARAFLSAFTDFYKGFSKHGF